MKKILIISLFSIFHNLFSQHYQVVLQPDVKTELNDIFIIDNANSWAVGNKGTIFFSSDMGLTWVPKSTQFNYDFLKVFFVNHNIGFIGTAQGRLLKTTDGGINWFEIIISTDFTYFDGIYFTSEYVGHIIVGKYKSVYIMRTSDGGETWVKKDSMVSPTTASRWYGITFYDENKGVIVGDKKDAQRYTSDGGVTWLKSNPINDVFFRDQKAVKWISSTTVISVGEGNEFWGVVTPIYKSTDEGKSWIKKVQYPENTYDRIKDVYFKNSNEGIAVGSNGFAFAYISKTTDGGETWYASFLNFSFGLKAIRGYGDNLIVLGTGSHLLSSSDFGQTWNLYKWFTPNSIYSIKFINNKGYVVNRSSDFYASETSNGLNWIFKSNTGLWESYAMQFIDENKGFILKENRHIVKTIDGGNTWQTTLNPVPFNARNKVGGLHFPSHNVGYAWMSLNDYSEYYIFKTTDGGSNWFEISMLNGPGYISGDIGFFDELTGIIAGPKRWMLRTIDGGLSWDTVKNFLNFPNTLPNKDFEDLIIINENEGWAVGDGFICFTVDKGENWNYVHHGLELNDSSFYTIANYRDSIIYISTYNGTILKTTNNGHTWNLDTSISNKYIVFSSSFNSEGRHFIGTANGFILASEPLTSINENINNSIGEYILIQNFPNPFNSSTKINYIVKSEGKISIIIYDLLGKKIISLVDKYHSPGIYEITWDGNDNNGKAVASGIYLIRLSINNYSFFRKIIKIN